MQFNGLNVVAFREISGIASENEVIVQHQVNKQGKATYVKTAGKLNWSEPRAQEGRATPT